MKRAVFLVALVLLFGVHPLTTFARTLELGSTGSDVTALQQKLIEKGYLSAAATGYFGSLTQAAVQKFQCEQAIICADASISGYGIAGPKTQSALGLSTSGTSVTLLSTLTGTSLTGAYTGPLEFSGWIPYWRAATGTADVIPHISQLKSVMPFVYTVKSDGTLYDNMKVASETWQQFIELAHQNKVRVVPTVMWGDGESIHRILSNQTTRIALEDEIAKLVFDNNFDGIDIDFEAKKPETINYFSTFLKGLYQRMGKKWVYCAIEARMPLSERYESTPPPDATNYANDYTQINKYCDRVEIMTYDQGSIAVKLNKQQSGPYAPVADVKWVESVVKLASQTIAKNKIMIGIPTYGYEYQVTPLTGGYKYQVLWPFNPTYAHNLAQKLSISPIRNSAGELSFSYISSGNYSTTGDQTDMAPSNTFGIMPDISYSDAATGTATSNPFNYVSWSDAQAIADKVALARKLGVRGVAVFKFDGGQDPLMWSVLK